MKSKFFTYYGNNKARNFFKTVLTILLILSFLPLDVLTVFAKASTNTNYYSPTQSLSDTVWKANIWRGGAGPYDVRKITENGQVIAYYAANAGTTNRINNATLEWLLVYDAATRDVVQNSFSSITFPTTGYNVVSQGNFVNSSPYHFSGSPGLSPYDTYLPPYLSKENEFNYYPTPYSKIDSILEGDISIGDLGIASEYTRSLVYRDIILQAVMQPLLLEQGSNDPYSTYYAQERLNRVRKFVNDCVDVLGQEQTDAILNSPNMSSLVTSISALDGENEKIVSNEDMSQFFSLLDLGQDALKLSGRLKDDLIPGLGLIGGIFHQKAWDEKVRSGVLVAILDRAIMIGEAEDRLILLQGYIDSFPAGSVDPAIKTGMDSAWDKFYEGLDGEVDFYEKVANQPHLLAESLVIVSEMSLGVISIISFAAGVTIIPTPITFGAGIFLMAIGIVISASGPQEYSFSWRGAILANELSQFIADQLHTWTPNNQSQVAFFDLLNISWYLKSMYFDFILKDTLKYSTSDWPFTTGTNPPTRAQIINEASEGKTKSLDYSHTSRFGLWVSPNNRQSLFLKILPQQSESGLVDQQVSSREGFYNTQFDFHIKFKNPNRQNISPDKVELVIDSNVHRIYSEGGSPLAGENFGGAFTGFDLGTHSFYFRAELGGQIFTYPQSGNPESFKIISNSIPPQINILSPNNEKAFRYFQVEWTDYDPDDEAIITLGYDTDNSGCNGTTIQNYISENWTTDWWTWRNLPTSGGPYWVYGIISDGKNPQVCDYSPGNLNIEKPALANGYRFDHFEIDDKNFGDGDGVWESGEQIKLSVFMKNAVNVELNDAYGVIYSSQNGDGIKIVDDDSTFWAATPGVIRGGTFELDSKSTFSGQVSIETRLYYRENGGPLMMDVEYIALTISPNGSEPNFQIKSITFSDNDLSEADNDGVPESGEDNIHTTITLKNVGGATASNVTAVVSQPVGFSGRWANPSVDYPDIAPGQSAGPLDLTLRLDDIPADFSGNLTQTLTVYYGVDQQFSKTVDFTVVVQPVPRIKLLELTYDFGIVSPGTPVTRDFQVTNIGAQTANITGVTTSHPDLSFVNSPASIAPGATATFHVVLNTTGLDSSITRTFTINSNAHLLSKNTGTIVGTVHDSQQSSYQVLFSDVPTSSISEVGGGDTDGDGLKEIIAADLYLDPVTSDNYALIIVYEQTSLSSDTYQEIWRSSSTVMPGSYGSNDIAVGDVNGDGKTDIIVVTGSDFGGKVYYLTTSGNNALTVTTIYSQTGHWLHSVAIGDADKDTYKDLLVGDEDTTVSGYKAYVFVLEYGGGTSFTKRWTSPEIVRPSPSTSMDDICAVGISDSDSDSYPELILGTQYGQVKIFENTGNNTFNSTLKLNRRLISALDSSLNGDCDLVAGEFDQDGKADIAYGNDDSNEMWVVENNGNDNWIDPPVWRQSVAPGELDDFLSIAAGDTSGDGKPDLSISYNGAPDGMTIYQAFQDNSYASIFAATASPVIEDRVDAIAVANVNQDSIPEILLAHSSGFTVLGLAKDLILTNVTVDPNLVTEGTETALSAHVSNGSGQTLSNIDVAFYNGDPSAGGSLLGTTTITSITNGASVTTTLNKSFPTAGIYTIHALVDPNNSINEGNKDNNKKSAPLTVVDNDQDPPNISNITITEYGGDGDGLFEDNEQIKIGWTATDPSGIATTNVTTDCTKGSATPLGGGNYQILVGPCIVGGQVFSITATDNDNSPLSRTTSNNSFQVHYHQPVINNINPANNATNVSRNTNILVWFGSAMTAGSITSSSFTVETLAGQSVSGSVTYDPALKKATFTPNSRLAAQTTYRVIIHGGVDGIRDENNNALATDYVWQFTTLPNQSPDVPFSPMPSDGQSNVPVNSNLSWRATDPDNDPLTFTVYFGTNNPPTTAICTNLQTYACGPGTLNEGQTYYWRIVVNDGSLIRQGPVWSFSTHTSSPEIEISIPDGDTTPDPVDGSDFGTVLVAGDSANHTFTIYNLGDANLNLTSTPKVIVSGTNAADFIVAMQPTSPIAPSGSATFTITFDPSTAGLRTATISIVNNDNNENPYNFSIQGTGVTDEHPYVLAITRADLNPTSAATVNFTATFSEAVTGVNTSAPFNDFALTTTGITGASITEVTSISGTTYTISINTGSGNGTIRLDVADNNSIVNAASNPLGGAAVGDGDFTSGEVYTINRNIETYIGGVLRGGYLLGPGESTRQNYVGVDSGPVKVMSTDGTQIVSAIREAWAVNGVTTSFFQMMGLPQEQLSDTYVFPGYNNVTLNEQLRISNVDTVPSTVTVTIGGVLRGTYPLAAGEAVRINYAGLDSGPVIVQGTTGVKIISAIREAWAVGGVTRSFVQLMGLPKQQLSDKYVFPGYNNVTLNEQLRIGNVDSVASTVTVTIGGVLRGTYILQPNEAVRVNYAGVDSGPVIVQGTAGVKIISAIREAWAVNGVTTSFAQLMGLPSGQLSNKYVFPGYNNVTLNDQLRIGNVDSVQTTVTVTIGGVLRGSYTLQPNEAVRVNYAGLDSGPVVVEGSAGVKIISAIREAWAVNGVTTSFTQLMGLPFEQLSSTFWFPAYNNVTLNEQLRIAVP